ncbi:hypothetical protein LG634_32890 [Streptomyces bambusae]|uniref:hypothetical protein n=1 Tax=Streptomyces bambusae TaxID=1550616 RepID=UPI001CFF55BD|nr:hypothetical protein [Streptomyces bambusae]MCB5169591.1 hypothetical protein [Streptomyces bambusae]
MSQNPNANPQQNPLPNPAGRLPLVPTLLLFVAAVAAWAGWLGWDQHRDVHPDGSVSGPYQPWQVIGLAVTLVLPVCWAAYRDHGRAAVAGTTGGLTVAAAFDWSDDASGLFALGAGMVLVGTLAATSAVCTAVSAVTRGRQQR